jgi:hypothetical protein
VVQAATLKSFGAFKRLRVEIGPVKSVEELEMPYDMLLEESG